MVSSAAAVAAFCLFLVTFLPSAVALLVFSDMVVIAFILKLVEDILVTSI